MRRASWIGCLIGCSGGGGGGDSGNCPAFATIVDGAFARVGTTLTWRLEVEELPAQLEFDREGVPNFVLEYGWIIELDSNRDGEPDWEVAAEHFKEDREPRLEAPLAVLQTDLWRVTGPAGTIAGSADAMIDGNTFTFTVDEDEDPDLANVVDPAQAHYRTHHQLGASRQCTDEL